MAYYATVRNLSTFRQKAASERAQSFSSLHDAKKESVSLWGRSHLFALRVLCDQPTANLAVLEPYLLSGGAPLDPCLQALIDGPIEELHVLAESSEPQIVRSYSPDSLGGVWSALAALQRPQNQSVTAAAEDVDVDVHVSENEDEGVRVPRNRQPPDRYGNLVPTESIQWSSSPPSVRPSTSSSMGSIGYTENPQAPAVEDLTVRLASSFIRFALNYGQELRRPILEFRDERVTHASATPSRRKLKAIDDGGVRILWEEEGKKCQHVALLEAKRCFQVIEDGRPTVSDELLAQMVGEALVSLAAPGSNAVSQSSVITIHATRQYVKFFHFQASNSYLFNFESLSPSDEDSELYFSVKSTSEWFDMGTRDGRKAIVRHVLALASWARVQADLSVVEVPDYDMDIEY